MTSKNAQQRKFELRMKLHNLKQVVDENIVDYLKRVDELITKLSSNSIEVSITTLKSMKINDKQDRITFECNKNFDYSFAKIFKLIKATYNDVERVNS